MSVIEARQQVAVTSGKSVILPLVASADISAFSPATITGYPADSANAFHKNIVYGITKAAIATGFSGNVVTEGEIENPAWTWTKGDKIFVNGTSLSTTPPSGAGKVRTMIGKAMSPTKIDVKIYPSVLLS